MTKTEFKKLASKARAQHIVLKDLLAHIDDDTMVSIGAASNYFFIGKKDEFFKNVECINDHFKELAKINCDRSISNFDYEKKKKGPVKKIKKDNPSIGISYMEASISRYKALLRLAKRQMDAYTWLINYIDILDRPVKDFFVRECEDGYAIIVVGPEQEGVWTRDEYVNGVDIRSEYTEE